MPHIGNMQIYAQRKVVVYYNTYCGHAIYRLVLHITRNTSMSRISSSSADIS